MARGFGRSGGGGAAPQDADNPTIGGRQFTGGSGLLGLAGALGAFDRKGEPDQTKINLNAKEQAAFGSIQDEMSQGHSMGQALMNVSRSQPDALHTIMLGGHLKDLATFQKMVDPPTAAGAGKQMVTKQGQQLIPGPDGTLAAQDIPGYRQAPDKGTKPQLKTFTETDAQGNTHTTYKPVDPNTGEVVGPGSEKGVTGAKPAKALTGQEEGQVTALNTILTNVDKLRNNVAASGSFGWGRGERYIAEHTPLSAQQGQAYNQAYNEIKSAVAGLGNSGRLKVQAQAMLDLLPDPHDAEAMNTNQAIPALGLKARNMVSTLAQTWHEEGKSTGAISQLAKTYEAGPNYMGQLQTARHALQNNPGQMTDEQVHIMENEANNSRLPYDEFTLTQKQRVQRGFISPEDWQKQVAAHPELNQIGDNERVATPRPWQDPNAPPAGPIPSGTPQAGGQPPVQPTSAPGQPPVPEQPPTPPMGGQPQQPTIGGTPPVGEQVAPPVQPQSQPVVPQGNPAAPPQGNAVPPGGVDPATLQPDAAELARQKATQDLISQSRSMSTGF